MDILKGKVVLITGGTGSFGKKFCQIVLDELSPAKVIIYSRDEYKQSVMQQQFVRHKNRIRFFIGDVRDKERLLRAFVGVDYVVHAAALKQVPAMEYNPAEAIKTNVIGAMNVIDAALDKKVKKVIALSTDKACNPINLYGATKLCSDKLFVAANSYSGVKGTKFSVVRYGNVIGSRGSVIPVFKEMRHTRVLPITHPEMTRFWITLENAVCFVVKSFQRMQGGEIFVPKIPSTNIMEIAKAIAPECKIEIIGRRSGEKMHESLISEDDAKYTKEFSDYYIIEPTVHTWWDGNIKVRGGRSVSEDFKYTSNNNPKKLTDEELKDLIKNQPDEF